MSSPPVSQRESACAGEWERGGVGAGLRERASRAMSGEGAKRAVALVAGPCGEELGRRGVAGLLERVLGRSEVEFGLATGLGFLLSFLFFSFSNITQTNSNSNSNLNSTLTLKQIKQCTSMNAQPS